ncbi:CYTH domain-containing protein [Fulvimarina sp. MAC8]|uniref:CYTH domain-containing protein n=1 Tax=Fulvimarina sp. MAC8 TaxID=3162874 RepID=UPI0032EE25DF
MAEEIERKFLVKSDEWREKADEGTRLEQFYLFIAEDRTCRVRIRNGDTARLTIKTGTGMARGEYEIDIPIAEAKTLREARIGRTIEKTRYRVPLGELTVEVDVFSGALDGFVLAEIEIPTVDHEVALPAYLGREVTDDPAYTNARMALDGWPAGGAEA